MIGKWVINFFILNTLFFKGYSKMHSAKIPGSYNDCDANGKFIGFPDFAYHSRIIESGVLPELIAQ